MDHNCQKFRCLSYIEFFWSHGRVSFQEVMKVRDIKTHLEYPCIFVCHNGNSHPYKDETPFALFLRMNGYLEYIPSALDVELHVFRISSKLKSLGSKKNSISNKVCCIN